MLEKQSIVSKDLRLVMNSKISEAPKYEFFSRLARIINSGQARSIVVSGNVNDLFFDGDGYVPLVPFLLKKTGVGGLIQVVYELNGPVRLSETDRVKLREAWAAWKLGMDTGSLAIREMGHESSKIDLRRREFDQYMRDAIGNATQALEFLRQLSICSRATLRENLLIFIEAADMLLPAGDGNIARMNDAQLRRVAIVTDWFSDPEFFSGRDTVCLVAESRSQIHPRISRLPQVLSVDVPAPDLNTRLHFLTWHNAQPTSQAIPVPEDLASQPSSENDSHDLAAIADATAGLSIHALRQLVLAAAYNRLPISRDEVVLQVEQFIQTQLGEDVVEFKKPTHTLKDVIGATRLKRFLGEYMLPRLRLSDDSALPGAAVAGPIGGGKTFIFEAVAAELDMPVLVLKSIRSQWFGQTDVIFERLKRVLTALEKVVIFVDEADTQFGGVGEGAHETERRLTGKIQGMMSDPALRGKVVWLLMTARIHLLSPDIRRPGRVGDLIVPVLDPTGQDRRDFITWMLKPTAGIGHELIDWLDTEGLPLEFSAAGFAALRSQLKAIPPQSEFELKEAIGDFIQPAIGLTRRYQTLQALVNCTRRSLLPDPNVSEEQRAQWEQEISLLEAQGIR
ncbi:MAG: AAA family ATPase [Planctomycetales bacterium]|nr:AAA family ATPase [Planctomycetales bacterium]